MTIYDMILARPELFYQPEHPWYEGELFMYQQAYSGFSMFVGFDSRPESAAALKASQPAAELAALYYDSAADAIWRHWFWTSDFDKHGQRIYCGVGPDEKGFEIHRHIHLTERFGVAVWR